MLDPDRLPPARLAGRQRAGLAAYLDGEVRPFSPEERARLDAAGGDLARVEPVALHEVDGAARVLRPAPATLGSSSLRWAWRGARLLGRRRRFVEDRLDPAYRAVHFDDHAGTAVGSSVADLDRLADLGRRWLERAGVTTDDVVVSIVPVDAGVAFWQLALGTRRAGIPTLHLGRVDAGAAAAHGPTVVVGGVEELAALADFDVRPHLALVVGGEPLHPDDRTDLSAMLGGATVRSAWAPPGVRALWTECVGGALHTWSDTEVVHEGPDGELVWSPLGWHGTVVLRLRTGWRGRVVEGTCPACARSSPRLDVAGPVDEDTDDHELLEARLAAVLDHHAHVAAWYAIVEGGDVEVHLAPEVGSRAALEAALGRLGTTLGVAAVGVERPSIVAATLAEAGHRILTPEEAGW